MNVQQLDKELDDSLQDFVKEMVFLSDTFDQTHQDEYLTKDDMEDISRQVFYAMNDFKTILIKHLRQANR